MASIEKYTLADGRDRWMVRYRKPNGRSTDKRGFTRLRDAEHWAAQTRVSMSDGSYILPEAGRTLVAGLHPLWKSKQDQLAPRTRSVNASAWKCHVLPYWGEWQLRRITTPDVREWVSLLQQEHKRDTVLRAVHVLRSILDTGVEARRLNANPAQDVKVRKDVPRRRPYLTAPQVQCLVSSTPEQYRALVSVLAFCGPRISEAAALEVQDYDPRRRRLTINKAIKGPGEIGPTKTFEQRTVPVPRFVDELLVEQTADRAPAEPLFRSPGGQRLDVGNWRSRVFAPAVQQARRDWAAENRSVFPDLTPHSLRHTTASLAISVGSNVLAVQRLLGHESPTTTLQVYAGLFPDDLDQVADAFDALRG